MIKDLIKQMEKKSIFSSVLLIIFSIFLILKPADMTKTLIIIIGVILLVDGIISIVNYLSSNKEFRLFSIGVFEGLFESLTGTLFLINYESLIVNFPIILGIIIIVKNVFRLQTTLALQQLDYKNWAYKFLISTIVILLGIVILINPFSTLKTLVISSGIIILISEIVNIIYSIFVIKEISKNDKTIKEVLFG